MIVDRTTINAGDIPLGQSRSFKVVVKNSFQEPIKVLNIRKSCTCTEASLNGYSLLQNGEQSSLEITITPGSTGLFSRNVYVDFEREGVGGFTDKIIINAVVK